MKKVNAIITRIENVVMMKVLDQDTATIPELRQTTGGHSVLSFSINKGKKMPVLFQKNETINFSEIERTLWQDEKTGINIKTHRSPLLTDNTIYLRGYDEEKNYNITTITFDNEWEAEDYANKVKKTLQNYNNGSTLSTNKKTINRCESLQDLGEEYNMFALVTVV